MIAVLPKRIRWVETFEWIFVLLQNNFQQTPPSRPFKAISSYGMIFINDEADIFFSYRNFSDGGLAKPLNAFLHKTRGHTFRRDYSKYSTKPHWNFVRIIFLPINTSILKQNFTVSKKCEGKLWSNKTRISTLPTKSRSVVWCWKKSKLPNSF